MKQQGSNKWQLNAGTGMALGALGGAIIALVVNMVSSDSSVWIWAIPVGLGVGLALGAGYASQRRRQ